MDEMGDMWQEVRLFIPHQDFAQWVSVEGQVQLSNSDLGHTAVDDFRLTDGSCQNPAGTQVT